MNIVIDFDHTLFNAEKFKQALRERFSLFGISSEQFDDSYQAVKNDIGYYNYQEHLNILAQANELDENDLLLNYQEIVDSAREFLCSDTIVFLKALKKIPSSILFLLAVGQDEFQQAKIEACDIEKYFEKVIDIQNSKIDFFKANEKFSDCILIDDKGSKIDEIKQQFPAIRAIWLTRPNSPYQKEVCLQKDFQANNLSEALNFIKTFINK